VLIFGQAGLTRSDMRNSQANIWVSAVRALLVRHRNIDQS
jgi:hypothetical protein